MWLDAPPPAARHLVNALLKAFSINGSRPEVGSSRMGMSASEAKAATSATFWRLPWSRCGLAVRVEFEPLDQRVAAATMVSATAQAAEEFDGLCAGQVQPQRDVTRNVGDPRCRSTASRPDRSPAVGQFHRRRAAGPSSTRMVVDLPACWGR